MGKTIRMKLFGDGHVEEIITETPPSADATPSLRMDMADAIDEALSDIHADEIDAPSADATAQVPPNAHACPTCKGWCVCAEFYDGDPCRHHCAAATAGERDRMLEIAARCQWADPSPWYTTEIEEDEGNTCIKHAHHDIYFIESDVRVTKQEPGYTSAEIESRERNVGCFLGDEQNARFIAHARSDVEWLLAELREAQRAINELREAIAMQSAAPTACAECARLREAATALYKAGFWEMDYDAMGISEQAKLWEALREALKVTPRAARHDG